MIFVDTGYFAALIHKRDELHEHASNWAKWVFHTNQRLLTTEQVLWETLNKASSPIVRQDATSLVDQLQRSDDIQILWTHTEDFIRAFDLYRNRLDKSWSLTDCLSFCVMDQYQITDALAYDLDFEQAGFRPLLRESPPR